MYTDIRGCPRFLYQNKPSKQVNFFCSTAGKPRKHHHEERNCEGQQKLLFIFIRSQLKLPSLFGNAPKKSAGKVLFVHEKSFSKHQNTNKQR